MSNGEKNIHNIVIIIEIDEHIQENEGKFLFHQTFVLLLLLTIDMMSPESAKLKFTSSFHSMRLKFVAIIDFQMAIGRKIKCTEMHTKKRCIFIFKIVRINLSIITCCRFNVRNFNIRGNADLVVSSNLKGSFILSLLVRYQKG